MLSTPSIIILVFIILVIGTLFACVYFDAFANPLTSSWQMAGHVESFWASPSSPVSPSNCPTCEWQCDDVECPQDCRSECAPPQCTIKCKPLAPARCTVKCDPPRCRNTCPDDGKCMRGECNLCQSVCDPPQCQVTCEPPQPECVTQCAPPNCKRVCVAPTNCPQPACRMVCA